ncbi:DUF2141 domain-containing protein [Elusimicrobiota bacterium]
MYRKFLFTLIVMCMFVGVLNSEEKSDITVRAVDFKNNKGVARFGLFNSKKGFPAKSKKAYMLAVSPIVNNKASVVFENVLNDEYAVNVWHDENNNNKIDSNFIGMPKEGVGVSNNAKGKFGPPPYKKSKFKVNTSTTISEIKINYLGKREG